jgi:toxin ParE1/3/4
VARLRISGPARADLAAILSTSLERWGEMGRARYAALLVATMRAIARDPEGPTTRDRRALGPQLRSLHVRHARGRQAPHQPVHVIFFRATESIVEIVRVLHERMEPGRHLPAERAPRRRRR